MHLLGEIGNWDLSDSVVLSNLIFSRRWRRSLTWSTMRLNMYYGHTLLLQGSKPTHHHHHCQRHHRHYRHHHCQRHHHHHHHFQCHHHHCFHLVFKAKYSAPTASREAASQIPGKGEKYSENSENIEQTPKKSPPLERKQGFLGTPWHVNIVELSCVLHMCVFCICFFLCSFVTWFVWVNLSRIDTVVAIQKVGA